MNRRNVSGQATALSTLERAVSIGPAKLGGLTLTVFAVGILGRAIHLVPITLMEAGYSLLSALVLTVYLAWLIPKVRLGLRSLVLLLWASLFAIEYVINYVEAVFFTTMFEGSYFVPLFGSPFASAIVSSLAVSLLVATVAVLLLGQGSGSGGVLASLRQHLSSRTARSWVLRIGVGAVSYFPIYFFFGMLISPFVLPYYDNSSYGLVIPSFSVMVPVELLRGFMYTVMLLPLLASLAGGRGVRFAVLASTLYVPGALIPLMGNSMLPPAIIPFHALEILGDSIVYGFVLSRVLGKPAGPAAVQYQTRV